MATLTSITKLVTKKIDTGEISLTWSHHDFEVLHQRLEKRFFVYRPLEEERTAWGSGPNEDPLALAWAAFEAYTGLKGPWFPETTTLDERVFCVKNSLRPEEIEEYRATPREVWKWARAMEMSRGPDSPYHLSTLGVIDLWKRNPKALAKSNASQLASWSEMRGLVPDRDLPFLGYLCARFKVDSHYLQEVVGDGGWKTVKENAKKLLDWDEEVDDRCWVLGIKPCALQRHSVQVAKHLIQVLCSLNGEKKDVIRAAEEVSFTWPYHKGNPERVWVQPAVVETVQKMFSASRGEAVGICQELSTLNHCRGFDKKWDLLFGTLPSAIRDSMKRPVVEWVIRHMNSRAMTKERPVHLPEGVTAGYRYIDMVDEVREEDLVNGVNTAPDRVMRAAKERRELVIRAAYENVEFPEKGVPYRNDDKLRWLKTSNSLKKEGEEMKHCVGSYVSACIDKKCWIYHFGDPAPQGVTVEINRDATGVPFVRQALGYGDSQQPAMVEELRKHLSKKEVKNV